MNLDALKYADLQQLAKSVGLKANMKADKLLKALKTHFEQEDSENGNGQVSDDEQTPTHTAKETSGPYVTKRRNAKRGDKQSAKRKHSNNRASDVHLKLQNTLALDVTKSAGNEDGRRSSKRRKVFSSKDMETASCEEPKENQPEMKPVSNNNDTATQQSDKGVSKKAAGKIPRLEGLLKKKVALKPTTPNFKKLHEAHFNKMESIDSYVQRRNKHMEELKNSIKALKKAPVRNASLFSPGVRERKPAPEKRRFTQVCASKTAVKEGAGVFRPSVLSTNRINVRFSPATQDNEHKRSLVKTPARMSPLVPPTPTPSRMSEARIRPDTINKTPKLTAFVFSGTSTTPATNKKTSFDLKASLSRPLSYKPHKGKLKPFGETQEATALGKSQLNTSHQKNYKQHQVQTREERRVKHREDRKQKKTTMLGTRRGLVMT